MSKWVKGKVIELASGGYVRNGWSPAWEGGGGGQKGRGGEGGS